MTPELRKRTLVAFYWKHHERLSELVKTHLEANNSCLILDCHSFPEKVLNRALDKSSFRPDFNIGTDEFHTPKELVEYAVKFFEVLSYSVLVDKPYSESMVPQFYYKKDKRVKSIMLEVNRKLYLDVDKKSDSYENTKKTVQSFLNHMRNCKTYF